jgi:hypothetical protein
MSSNVLFNGARLLSQLHRKAQTGESQSRPVGAYGKNYHKNDQCKKELMEWHKW